MFTALSATSRTLAEHLRPQLEADIEFFRDGTMVVSLNNPQEMEGPQGSDGLSLWLYRVVRDEQRLNAPRRRLGTAEFERVPLPVRLHYLATPIVNPQSIDPESPLLEQTILGRVLQAFHDNPVLRGSVLAGDFAGTDLELHVRLETMSLEEITRVWDALERSYQLSVSYEVSIVYICSQHEPERVEPVAVPLPEYGVITASEPV